MKSLVLLILISGFASAQFDERWNELYSMVQQEIKIVEKSKSKKPRLELRLLELYTEKLKLLQEKNNREFMAASKQSPVAKAPYFKETRQQYEITKAYGLTLVKANHPYKSEAAFLVGLNSRDYGRGELTEEMLSHSLAHSRDSNSSRLTRAALAENLYNNMKYAAAIPHYESVVTHKEDKWFPKHSYNLAWCYVKEKRFADAMNTMALALRSNNDPRYVKIPNDTLSSLSSFYAYVGKPMVAMELFVKEFADPFPFLLGLARKTSENGHGKETIQILVEAQKAIIKNKNLLQQEELLNFYLDFYRQYGRYPDHVRISSKLTSLYQKNPGVVFNFRPEVISKLRAMAGFLHLKLTKDTKGSSVAFKESDLQNVISYYRHLSSMDVKRKAEYLYFEGETYYSVQRLADAAVAYSASIHESQLSQDHATTLKAINSLLALTGTEKLPKEENKKYLTLAYATHVKLWPKSEKSKIIYPKLFQIYYLEENDKEAAHVLSAFHQSFPSELRQQQALMTRVVDKSIEKKDTPKLSSWITQFKSGFLSYDKVTITKMELALGGILFNEYQAMAKRGDKLAAARGFESIYHNQLYSSKVKSEAALYASMAYLEAGDTSTSARWNKIALATLEPHSALKHRPEEVKMIERTYQLQDFKTAFELATMNMDHNCEIRDDSGQRFFEIAVMTSLVEKDYHATRKTIQKYSACAKDPVSREIASVQLYRAHEKKNDYSGLSDLLVSFPHPKYPELWKNTLARWYWDGQHESYRDRIEKVWETSPDPKQKKWHQEITLLRMAKSRVDELNQESIWNQAMFVPAKFNASIEEHLKHHQKFKESYEHLLQASQPEVVVDASLCFSELYQNLGEKLAKLSPSGLNPKTLNEIKTAMNNLAGQFKTIALRYQQDGKRVAKSQQGLTEITRGIASLDGIENPIFSSQDTREAK
jgi:hypothetical protein